MKYIDTDKLIAEIERRIAAYQKNFDKADNKIAKLSTDGRIASLKGILPFITSLQQEQQEEVECEDLEEAAEHYADYNSRRWQEDGDIYYDHSKIKDAFIAGAEWGEKNAYKAIMKKADEVRDKKFNTDYEVKIEPAAGFDLGCINVYREGKLVGQYVEPKEEKKLPEDLEEAAKKYDEAESWRWEAPKYPRREAFEAGAEWQKEQMKKGNPIVMSVEDFQALIDNTIKRAEKEAREQMMKESVEGFVGVHLHDKRADVTVNTGYLPKEMGIRGDSKVRVIIVKEEEE